MIVRPYEDFDFCSYTIRVETRSTSDPTNSSYFPFFLPTVYVKEEQINYALEIFTVEIGDTGVAQ